MLKMDDDYTPTISEYIVAKVSSVNKSTCHLQMYIIGKHNIYTYYKTKSSAASVCLSARQKLKNYCTDFHGVFTNR